MSDAQHGVGRVSLDDLIRIVVKGRTLIAVAAVLGLAVGAATGLLRERTWTSESSFIPNQGRGSNSLSGLAAQLGVQVPTSDGSLSPALFADLVRSDEVLRPVIEGTDPDSGLGPGPAELRALLGVDARNEAEATVRSISALSRRISASVNARTQVVRVHVSLPDPQAAASINARVLASLADVIQRSRQAQASAERRFNAERLQAVEGELRAAENALRGFAERNRDISGSPALRQEFASLEREIMLRQQLFVSLSQAVEQARIEEMRDTPTATILQRPRLPVFPDPRGTVARGIIGMVTALAIAFLWLAARGYSRLQEPAGRQHVASVGSSPGLAS